MTRRRGEKGTFWRVGGRPLAVSLLCVLAGWLLLRLDSSPPPNCDFSCAMASIGWEYSLGLLLLGGGILASGVFILVCLILYISRGP
ncbi:hypothetical protein E1264_33495 [Actinomadura sp. KC216]|uniref:hypothetical protein n=1 Tax=Actinomadura sp. KC216 TaxID=2530370 RepID=UPI001053B8BE|nr:hypothetical protein [Actinomadura sp. KC216]TDB80854.1 hypothetical protein E1264_33495 [Actinomadura sp. KC216]